MKMPPIIAIMPDTIIIEVDIMNEHDGEAMTKSSTIRHHMFMPHNYDYIENKKEGKKY